MCDQLHKTAAALASRGFESHVFDTAAQAAQFLLNDIPADAIVGVGGSMTIRNMELHTQLRERGHKVLWHWEATPAQKADVLARAMHADCYLASANAITHDGLIVQIDGTGNRVSALIYGPKTVYLVVGRNKLVAGGYPQAVARIKQAACPPNARRLGLDTPCAATGRCNVSACKTSMCSVTVALERTPGGRRFVVALVNEDLGY